MVYSTAASRTMTLNMLNVSLFPEGKIYARETYHKLSLFLRVRISSSELSPSSSTDVKNAIFDLVSQVGNECQKSS